MGGYIGKEGGRDEENNEGGKRGEGSGDVGSWNIAVCGCVVDPYTHFYKFDTLTNATNRLIFNSSQRSREIARGADRFWTLLFSPDSRIPVMLFGVFYIKIVYNHIVYIVGQSLRIALGRFC